ncbi:MAG: linear amide C-N hydrolase [Anaerolineaceae bacterium]|nr:linear amide C-N hydrolase [Anaerolineaceae bacterium]
MTRNRSHAIRLLLAVLCLIAMIVLLWNPARSLLSFQKVTDFPLYSMHLYSNNSFTRYIQESERAIKPISSRQTAPNWACTVFSAADPKGAPLLGRNFDWNHNPALLLFNHPQEGYDSVTMVDISYLGFDLNDASFIDRFQAFDAAHIPFDGLNEAGLAVGMNAVSHAEAWLDPQNPTIGSLAPIRLILDQAATVEEALALLQNYNIDFEGETPIHYLIADASGASVIIEYIDNEMRILEPQNPGWQVSTNFLFSERPAEQWPQMCNRYRHADETLAKNSGQLDASSAMSLLQNVSQSNTRWSIVYHMDSGEIDLVMGRDYGDVLHFDLH